MGYMNNMPTIRNYQEAVAHEASVKPIRGNPTNLKPLAGRRYQWHRIRKDGEDVHVVFGDLTVVIYKPTGEIILPFPRYQSLDYINIVSHLLCTPLTRKDHKTWIMCNFNNGVEVVRGYLPIVIPNIKYPVPNVFKREEYEASKGKYGARLFAIDPVFPIRKSLNRKKVNLLRKKYEGAYKYVSGVAKLVDGEYDLSNNLGGGDFAFDKLLSEDQEERHNAAKFFLMISAVTNYSYELRGHVRTISLATLRKNIDRQMFAKHKNEVLIRKEDRSGEIVVDHYPYL